MPFTKNEISSLVDLISDVVRSELQPVRDEVQLFRSEVNASFDALSKRDETREEEYLSMRRQLADLEAKLLPAR